MFSLRRFFFVLTALAFGTCCAATQFTTAEEDPVVIVMPTLEPAPEPAAGNKFEVIKFQFTGDVTEASARAAVVIIDQLAAKNPDILLLELNSTGGEMDPGFLIAKAIEDFPGRVVCVVDGNTMSTAFYILQSCPERFSTDRSEIMAHEPFFKLNQQMTLTRGTIAYYERRQKLISKIWTAHAGKRLNITMAEFRARTRGDWYMDAEEALVVGAIDGIVESVAALRASLEKNGSAPGQATPPAIAPPAAP